jgi:ribonuclease BN (tRNA processing enzyme)
VLITQNNFTLLIDCGPTVPAAVFRQHIGSDELDAIYITHSHPDHSLGLTTLLNWMDSKKRTRPLTLIAQREQRGVLEPLVQFAYWPVERLNYKIEWRDSEELDVLGPWTAQTEPTQHAVNNLSLHLTTKCGHQLFYSGDGQLVDKSLALACQSDLVFVECETIAPHISHGSWTQLSDVNVKPGSQWKLYHIDPSERTPLVESIADRAEFSLAVEGELLIVSRDWEQENVA